MASGEERRADYSNRSASTGSIRDALRAGYQPKNTPSYDTFSTTHVFGTCRMGTAEDDSVVDPTGRSHRWKSLYAASGEWRVANGEL